MVSFFHFVEQLWDCQKYIVSVFLVLFFPAMKRYYRHEWRCLPSVGLASLRLGWRSTLDYWQGRRSGRRHRRFDRNMRDAAFRDPLYMFTVTLMLSGCGDPASNARLWPIFSFIWYVGLAYLCVPTMLVVSGRTAMHGSVSMRREVSVHCISVVARRDSSLIKEEVIPSCFEMLEITGVPLR